MNNKDIGQQKLKIRIYTGIRREKENVGEVRKGGWGGKDREEDYIR